MPLQASSTNPPEESAASPAYIYVLYGADEFSLSEQVTALREKMRQFAAGDYNIALLEGSETRIEDVIAAGEAVPFLADRRMVVVRGLLGPGGGATSTRTRRGRRQGTEKASDEPVARLLDWIPRAPTTTSLVFIERDVSESVLAQLSQMPRVVVRRFDPPRGERLVRWVHARARRHGTALAAEAAEALAATTDDLRRLDSELAKLAAHADGEMVSTESVHHLVAGAETNVFALLDAVAERRTGDALAALRALFEQGQRPEAIVAQLASLLRRLLVVKELARQGAVSAPEAGAHGLNPNSLPKLQRQARALESEELERALARLLDADRASKSGRMDPELAIELAVSELATATRSRTPPPPRLSV